MDNAGFDPKVTPPPVLTRVLLEKKDGTRLFGILHEAHGYMDDEGRAVHPVRWFHLPDSAGGAAQGKQHHAPASGTPGVFDRDEAFWRKIRELPEEVKMRGDVMEMLTFKKKVEMLNRDIEHAIELRLAGWAASLPDGPLDVERVFAWQWRSPGPRGGRLYLSTGQAIGALRSRSQIKDSSHE